MHGYLRSLLKGLEVPESSQVLVFSKTSFQRERISPETPRALYFSDDVMVGFCDRGRVMEISAADEVIGTAFYTIDQTPGGRPVIQRQTETCLLCHSSSANLGFPGHLVRSVFVDSQGIPLLASGSHRTDHTSPLAERWGGWYVTGTSGRQKHMGNLICPVRGRPEQVDNAAGSKRRRPQRSVQDVTLPDAPQRHRGADGARTPGRHAQPPRPRGHGDADGALLSGRDQ